MKHSFPTAIALVGAALAATATIATAQNYPTKPIRFIATEVVGSATDIQARIIAKGMAQVVGQPIEIENLFGEAGVVKGIHSPPDGYTIVYGGAGTLALLPHIKKVSYDGQKDLTPGRPLRGEPDAHGGQSVAAGEDRAGPRRPDEGQSGQASHVDRGRRHRRPFRRRDVHRHGGREDRDRPLSGRRTGD
jgi:hypothetical protein